MSYDSGDAETILHSSINILDNSNHSNVNHLNCNSIEEGPVSCDSLKSFITNCVEVSVNNDVLQLLSEENKEEVKEDKRKSNDKKEMTVEDKITKEDGKILDKEESNKAANEESEIKEDPSLHDENEEKSFDNESDSENEEKQDKNVVDVDIQNQIEEDPFNVQEGFYFLILLLFQT